MEAAGQRYRRQGPSVLSGWTGQARFVRGCARLAGPARVVVSRHAAWRLPGRVLRLVLPVLVPSWRFFDSIGPSPRLEYQWRAPEAPEDPAQAWTPWVLTPARVGVGTMFARLFFNAARNETLYLLACCERLLDDGSRHAEQEIAARLSAHLHEGRLAAPGLVRFRVVEVHREAGQLQRQVAFVSAAFAVPVAAPP
jgi:hypothetical protein